MSEENIVLRAWFTHWILYSFGVLLFCVGNIFTEQFDGSIWVFFIFKFEASEHSHTWVQLGTERETKRVVGLFGKMCVCMPYFTNPAVSWCECVCDLLEGGFRSIKKFYWSRLLESKMKILTKIYTM